MPPSAVPTEIGLGALQPKNPTSGGNTFNDFSQNKLKNKKIVVGNKHIAHAIQHCHND